MKEMNVEQIKLQIERIERLIMKYNPTKEDCEKFEFYLKSILIEVDPKHSINYLRQEL